MKTADNHLAIFYEEEKDPSIFPNSLRYYQLSVMFVNKDTLETSKKVLRDFGASNEHLNHGIGSIILDGEGNFYLTYLLANEEYNDDPYFKGGLSLIKVSSKGEFAGIKTYDRVDTHLFVLETNSIIIQNKNVFVLGTIRDTENDKLNFFHIKTNFENWSMDAYVIDEYEMHLTGKVISIFFIQLICLIIIFGFLEFTMNDKKIKFYKRPTSDYLFLFLIHMVAYAPLLTNIMDLIYLYYSLTIVYLLSMFLLMIRKQFDITNPRILLVTVVYVLTMAFMCFFFRTFSQLNAFSGLGYIWVMAVGIAIKETAYNILIKVHPVDEDFCSNLSKED